MSCRSSRLSGKILRLGVDCQPDPHRKIGVPVLLQTPCQMGHIARGHRDTVHQHKTPMAQTLARQTSRLPLGTGGRASWEARLVTRHRRGVWLPRHPAGDHVGCASRTRVFKH